MTNITMTEVAEAEFGLAKRHWVLLLILGIMMIIFGMIGFMQPVAYTVATTVLFGALLLVNGGAGIVTAFKLEGWKGKTAVILLALLFIATGMLLILPDTPAALGLQDNPQPSLAVNAWQNVVQPLSVGTLGLSIGVTALSFIVARREHAREQALLKEKEASNDKPNAA